MSTTRLRMAGVEKRFGATHALKHVSLEIRPGEVHALIGENGAGKSTLMKVLSGAYSPDAGTIELDQQPYAPSSPSEGKQRGIAMIYQELTLAPHLSVEENILLGEEPSRLGWINKRERSRLARKALAELQHENIPLHAPVNTRTIAEQQIVEIARTLISEPKVLIMDEPTSSLTQVDTRNLFQVIRKLKQRGVSIIYISHFLEECQEICDRFTVLRDGESVGSGDMATTHLESIIRMMVGREIQDIYPRTPHPIGNTVLEFQQLKGKTKPQDVCLGLREGEIMGVAGLIGSGRTETLRAAFGLDGLQSGTVLVIGHPDTDCSPSKRLEQGIGLLSEDRKEEGLMLNRSLADNLTLTRYGGVSRFGWINRSKQLEVTREWISRLNVKTQGPMQPIGALSGGNQQKIAIGRLLYHDARILLLDEPTRGIDVGSKAEIYKLIGQLAAQGKSVIFVSSYLPELLGVCDTIGVMYRGVLSKVRPVGDWTEHSIISTAIGQPEAG